MPASGGGEGQGGSPLWFFGLCLSTLLFAWLALRLVLFSRFVPSVSTGILGHALLQGFWRDALVGFWMVLPIVVWPVMVPLRRTWTRLLFWTVCLIFWFVQTFILFAEYYFFDEFRSRFNTVAVDYLQYPTEVFVNIWDSYHVGLVLLVCIVPSALWVFTARRWFGAMWDRPVISTRMNRSLAFAACVMLWLLPIAFLGGSLAGIFASPLHLGGPHVAEERTINEVANNGQLAFLSAGLTHRLEYTAFYRTLPGRQDYARVRTLLNGPGVQFDARPDSILRLLPGDPNKPRLNVVILLEESFGSEFWGCLGRSNTLTPEMDRLAAEQGILFTNLYASGNRTVRGMEGVLASFPPLPGESIVKRDLSDDVETVARVFKRDGYSTVFLYGGRGVFDGMRSFTLRNGYDRFVEEKHFEHPTFTTVWGVCDEDLYDRAVEELGALSRSGQPFFATILSVSNHKPFTYPKGKIAANPDEKRRENAVSYSDYALGQFFKKVRTEPFWTNTVFAVVADHGARVYGEQSIPIHSYEIPLLIVGPAVVNRPSRVGQLGCSLDVAPTLLGLVGRPYRSTFFGQDLLHSTVDNGRALMNHNRDIGLLGHERLAVLGLMKGEEFYAADAPHAEMKLLHSPQSLERELQADAMALFQVADDLYAHQRYRVEPDTHTNPPTGLSSTRHSQP